MNLLFIIINVALSCAVLPGTIATKVPIKNHPYQVSVHDALNHVCSGSIISERFVLSAAVCFKKNPDNEETSAINLTIHAGSFSPSRGSVHRIARIIRHENFHYNEDFGTSRNNLALIEVRGPFVIDENHQPIELFDESEDAQSNKTAVISGWPVNESGARAEQLLIAKVAIVDRKSCDNAHNEYHKILDNEICAAGYDFKYFDWGSALVVDGRLAGVASWDIAGFGDRDTPKVFTNVAYYREWINARARSV